MSIATVNNHSGIVTLLLTKGASTTKATSSRQDVGSDIGLLHLAALHDSTNAAAALVRGGMNIDAFNKFGFAALHIAAEYDSIGVATFLLDNGATVDLLSDNLRFPITYAIISRNLSMVKLLLARGADPNSKAGEEGFTPISYAADADAGVIIQLLLDNGADIDAQPTTGATALYFAAMYGNQNAIEVLVGNGADKSLMAFGETPKEVLCQCTLWLRIPDECSTKACEDQKAMLDLLS